MIIALGKGASRSGGGSGVGNYYLYGTNGDRDKKDFRLVLHGNLDTLARTIDLAHHMNYKETYRNIVLSFSEDYLNKETLEHIVEDFKKQYMAGYDEDEYVFYAEAHLSKIKVKKDPNTGEIIHRKPHVHISIATYSPKLDKALSLGNHGQRLKELDTWKSVTEKKYGLKPAQNSPLKRDITQIYDTKLLGRKEFIELCNQVIEDNLKDKILDRHSLKMTLLENIEGIEDIKESTSKAKTPYFAIKMKNSDKPIRLKGDLFSSNHLLFKEAREQLVKKQIGETYCEVGKPRNIPTALQNTLDIYCEKRFEYVQKREAAARAKLNAVHSEFEMIDLNGLPTVQKEDCRPLISAVQTMMHSLQENIDARQSSSARYAEYKKILDPQYVFNYLKIDYSRYTVSTIKGEYRIRCGKRNLNLHDFLTKEMHMSWSDAKELMDYAHQQQKNTIGKHQEKTTKNIFKSYQQKILYDAYSKHIEHDLKHYYVEVKEDTVSIASKKHEVTIVDYGHEIEAFGENIQEQVKLMLDIAQAKGWDLQALDIEGSDEFKEETFKQIEQRLESSNRVKELDEMGVQIKTLNTMLESKANLKYTNDDTTSARQTSQVDKTKTGKKNRHR